MGGAGRGRGRGGGGGGRRRGGGGKGGGTQFTSMPVPKFLQQYQDMLPGATGSREGYEGGRDAGADVVAKFLAERAAAGDDDDAGSAPVAPADAIADGATVVGDVGDAEPARKAASVEPTILPDDARDAAETAAAPTFKRPTPAAAEGDAMPRKKKKKKQAAPNLLSFDDE